MKNKGITLIALVITIIVLLILSAVTIAMLTGDEGILTKTIDARDAQNNGTEKDQIGLAYNASKLDSKGKEITIDKLQGELQKYDKDIKVRKNTEGYRVTYPNGNKYTINKEGKIEGPNKIEPVKKEIELGDYVIYEPTKEDLEGNKPVEETKLTYTSPKETEATEEEKAKEILIGHGNGNSDQKYTAKPNTGTEKGVGWRVFDIEGDKITLISDKVVEKDEGENKNFIMQGIRGYLYAEQELHEISKIYGYGYGADTTIETIYTIGGPEDTQEDENGNQVPITRKITGSGARSITMDDINKKAGVYFDSTDGKLKYSDGSVDSKYGSTENPTTPLYYATLNSDDKAYPGKSKDKKTNFKHTMYDYSLYGVDKNCGGNIVLNVGHFWVADQAINIDTGFMLYGCSFISLSYGVRHHALTKAISVNVGAENFKPDNTAVRPLVILKPNVIDTEAGYDEDIGGWKLK